MSDIVPNAYSAYYAAFPWLTQIGITPAQIQAWVVEGYEGDALVGMIRQTPQWQARFASARRADGTLRMNESEYLQREDDYRQVLAQWGIDVSRDYSDPASFMAFFEGEIDPNELNQRFEVYDSIKRQGASVREAMYVYAGMRISDDDLYEAVVDPSKAEALTAEYQNRVTREPLDYATWITRATEAGLERVTEALTGLQEQGVAADQAAAQIRQLNPDFARQMMDVLLHGGDPGTGKFLSLTEVLHAFEYAMIGSAATDNGFTLPTSERIEAMRQAGIDRAAALESYGKFASQRNQLMGAFQRAHRGEFTQDDWERAVFLRQGSAVAELEQALAHEEALSKAGGSSGFSQDEVGRFQQVGLRSAF